MLNGDGMVNYLWRVQSRDKEHSVVIKYGEEQMKVGQNHTRINHEQKINAENCWSL